MYRRDNNHRLQIQILWLLQHFSTHNSLSKSCIPPWKQRQRLCSTSCPRRHSQSLDTSIVHCMEVLSDHCAHNNLLHAHVGFFLSIIILAFHAPGTQVCCLQTPKKLKTADSLSFTGSETCSFPLRLKQYTLGQVFHVWPSRSFVLPWTKSGYTVTPISLY